MNSINLRKKSIKIELLDGKIEVWKNELQPAGVTWEAGIASEGELAQFAKAFESASDLAERLDRLILSPNDYSRIILEINSKYSSIGVYSVKMLSGHIEIFAPAGTEYLGEFFEVSTR